MAEELTLASLAPYLKAIERGEILRVRVRRFLKSPGARLLWLVKDEAGNVLHCERSMSEALKEVDDNGYVLIPD